jgi:zinc protease
LLNAIQRGNDVEWIDEYPRVIQSLSLEEVNAAVKKFLDPNRMVLVQAGTLSSVEKK